MASQVPPIKGAAYSFSAFVVSQANTKIFQVNPTLAAGDIKIVIDGGAPANIATLPTVDADFTKRIPVVLSTSEMNGDVIDILLSDAAGDEWCDVSYQIHTSSVLNDDLPTAAEVWTSATRTLTQSAASVTAAVTGSNISVARGTTWVIALTNIGALTSYDTVYFTVKKHPEQADTEALLRVYNHLTTGLIRFNGAAPVSVANGKIVIDDIPTGDITITVQEEETVSAPVGKYDYDIKGIDNDGNVDLLSSGGLFLVTPDVTRAIVSP